MGVGGSGRRPAARGPGAKSSRDTMRRKTLGKVRVCYACLLDDVIPEPDHPSGQRVLQLLGAQRPDDAPETSQGGILESAALVLKEPGRLDGPAKVGIGEIFPERYGGGKARAQGGRNQPLWRVVTMQAVSHVTRQRQANTRLQTVRARRAVWAGRLYRISG